MIYNPKPNESEGENFLEDFFTEIGIKFERETKISDLKSDSRQYRVADFYLPKFKVYVEFFGLWNKNIKDDDYRLKKEIYKANGIPCVYIYPENLGIVKYIFDKRLQEALKAHNMQKELNNYRIFKLKNSERFETSLFFSILSLALFIYNSINYVNSGVLELNGFVFFSAICLTVAVYHANVLCKLYRDIFKHNRFSLEKLKY